MIYQNPIVRGFYPDPSVCAANGKYYLACSSFQYFPGVPIFESEDLVNWTQIGHVLTRESQVMLDKVRSSGGVFAPTIRYHEGRFYMVTNNNSTNKNFYVYTDDIYGEWSDPIEVDQDGIDPSLFFEDGHCYFISNGHDEDDINGILQCEINIETGEKIGKSKRIWSGSGGRYIESPHMYKIGDYYYLMAAEGGTEYGHMVTYARSTSVWGPFEGYEKNPVLTNRNKAPYIIQAIGHGDLIQNFAGDWYIVTLGFRQIHLWQPFHHLGREVFLTPVYFSDDGWFTAGHDGTTDFTYEIPGDFSQKRKNLYTFENTRWDIDWCYMRKMRPENYELSDDKAILKGCELTLEDVDTPTFIGLRQLDFNMELGVNLSITENMDISNDVSAPPTAGITIYGCENEHYDLLLRKITTKANVQNTSSWDTGSNEVRAYEAVLRLNIGDIKHEQACIPLDSASCRLIIRSDALTYHFSIQTGTEEISLGSAQSKYLSSEVSSGFTGVILGLFAEGNCKGGFTNFKCEYL